MARKPPPPPSPPYLLLHKFQVGLSPAATNCIGAYAIPTEEMAKQLREDVNLGLSAVSNFIVQCHPALGTIEGGLAFVDNSGDVRCTVVGTGQMALLLASRQRPGTKLILFDEPYEAGFEGRLKAFVDSHAPKAERKAEAEAEAEADKPVAIDRYVASALVAVGPKAKKPLETVGKILALHGLHPLALLRTEPTIVFAAVAAE